MENKIKAKRVGDVNIFEFQGEFKGDFATRGEEAMRQVLANNRKKNVLFNLQGLSRMDQQGIAAILHSAQSAQKSAIYTDVDELLEPIKNQDQQNKMAYFVDKDNVAYYFSREFAAPSFDEYLNPERRRFIRLASSLPTHFWFEDEGGKLFRYFAVVTNISEGGLFAQFIESVSEEGIKKNLNPYDFQLIHIRVGMQQNDDPLDAIGKLIHGNIREGGIGIEFYDMDVKNRERLSNWIREHLKK